MTNEIMKLEQRDFPAFLTRNANNPGLVMPFTREIFLRACHIAGTNFRPHLAEIAPQLQPGAVFRLQREPHNQFDASAIAVYDTRNNHLGYIPKTVNAIPARLLDAGKNLSAKLVAKQWNDSWLKLDIEIFLHD